MGWSVAPDPAKGACCSPILGGDRQSDLARCRPGGPSGSSPDTRYRLLKGPVRSAQPSVGSPRNRRCAASTKAVWGACAANRRWTCRAWWANRPAIENSCNRSRLGSHRRAGCPARPGICIQAAGFEPAPRLRSGCPGRTPYEADLVFHSWPCLRLWPWARVTIRLTNRSDR